MSETLQIIRDMAKLSLLTNKINDIQEKNLKLYALAFFEGVRSANIDYDFSHQKLVETEENKKSLELTYKFKDIDTNHFRVSYHLDIDDTVQTHLDKRFAAIEQAVRTLFWKDVKVEVYFNETKSFESKYV